MKFTEQQMIEIKARNQRILNDYLLGLTRVQLAEKYKLSCVDHVLKASGITFGKKGGNRRKIELNKDRLWINKQIVALVKQGFTTVEIKKRYDVNTNRIVSVKREAGILSGRKIEAAVAKNVSDIPSFRDATIPYGDNCDVKPKRYSDHYSQVIWR
jgi:Mor family transcriptional regulator